MSSPTPSPSAPRGAAPRLGTCVVAAIIAATTGLWAVYAMARGSDNAGRPAMASGIVVAQATSGQPAPSGSGTNALSVGEMAKFVFRREPEPLPEISFVDAAGKARTLADWKGKVVLLNLWATWCLPCRKEMPGLDRLQAELGSDKFEVVALSVDRAGVEASRKFLDQIKVTKLGLYADPTTRASSTLKVIGMPATLLIDARGREIGRLVGPAEWDSPEAKALIGSVLR
jgi:thiol-disulfide isomerase/thioredoxin